MTSKLSWCALLMGLISIPQHLHERAFGPCEPRFPSTTKLVRQDVLLSVRGQLLQNVLLSIPLHLQELFRDTHPISTKA